MRKQYVVKLTDEQREKCTQLVRSGTAPARTLVHARVLLKTDTSPDGPHWTDQQISEAFDISTGTVANIRKRFVGHGFDEALTHYRDPDRDYQRKLDGRQKAHLWQQVSTNFPNCWHYSPSLYCTGGCWTYPLDKQTTILYNICNRLRNRWQ